MKDNALISQFRTSFGLPKDEKMYKRDFDQDSFSVSGVLFDVAQHKYIQRKPMVHKSTKDLEIEVIFHKDDIYIFQDNLIYQKISHQKCTWTKDGQKDFSEWNITQSKTKKKEISKVLCFEAQNCIAKIEKLDDKNSFFRRRIDSVCNYDYLQSRIIDLEVPEFKLLDCAICYSESKEATILECNHHFCNDCIEQWKQRKSNCPVCRQTIN